MIRKFSIGIVIIFVTVSVGFAFLLRGCLSNYDERSAITPALVFEKDNRSVVFGIVKYGKTVSYEQNGGITQKQMSTNYFIQSNDAVTGELIANKKIKHNKDIKFHPVTVMGSGNGKAWIFMGELLAFDPFTLEKFADKEIIEAKNPPLKGKMPEEKRYYVYKEDTDEIVITATDGVKYILSTTSMQATTVDEDETLKSQVELKLTELKKEESSLNENYKNRYDRYRVFNKLYAQKKISQMAYMDSVKNFNHQRDEIDEQRKLITQEIHDLQMSKSAERDRTNAIDNLKGGSKSYINICTAIDSFNGRWYGLLNAADLEKTESRFRYRTVTAETGRNKLYSAALTLKDSTAKILELIVAKPEKIADAVYLQGGFLLDRSTALPIQLKNTDGFIVCHREKVGSLGNIILSRVDLTGNIAWTFNTKLLSFNDWIFTGSRLVIFGNDNKELSSSDANLLTIIDLKNGQAVMYDYFTDKMRKE